MPDYKYDVAISFCFEDEAIARELRDLLQPRVKSIFFYPENQREALGQNGAVLYRTIFRDESRFVVVVLRKRWGEAGWTQVEKSAIQEMGLEHGWDRVVAHTTDGTVPVWLPKVYIWSSTQYGLSALAAAIEYKLQELGADVGYEEPAAMAQRISRQREAESRRAARRHGVEAVGIATGEITAISERLAELAGGTADPLRVFYHPALSGLRTILTVRVALGLRWHSSVNSIVEAKLRLYISNGALGFRGWTTKGSREVESYELHLAEDEATWLWVDDKGTRYPSATLADEFFRLLLREDEQRRKHPPDVLEFEVR